MPEFTLPPVPPHAQTAPCSKNGCGRKVRFVRRVFKRRIAERGVKESGMAQERYEFFCDRHGQALADFNGGSFVDLYPRGMSPRRKG